MLVLSESGRGPTLHPAYKWDSAGLHRAPIVNN